MTAKNNINILGCHGPIREKGLMNKLKKKKSLRVETVSVNYNNKYLFAS